MDPFETIHGGSEDEPQKQEAPELIPEDLSGETGLMTFHHLIYDSLMPWLSQYNDELLFRALLIDLMPNSPLFFEKLIPAFASRGMGPDPVLRREWQVFAAQRPNKLTSALIKSMFVPRTASQKEAFYFYLIINSMFKSISLLDALIGDASAAMRPYYLRKTLGQIGDMRKKLPLLLSERPAESRLIYCCDLALHLIGSCFLQQQKHLGLRYLLAIPLLEPPHGSADWDSFLLQQLYQWYHQHATGKARSQNDTGNGTQTGDGDQNNPPPATMPSHSDPEALLTVKEVLPLLGMAKTTLYDLCKKNKFPHVKIGRSYRFNRQEIKQYIDQHSTKASP